MLNGQVQRRWLWPVVAIFALVVAVLFVGWQVYETQQDSEIREGAVVRGVDIGGLEPEEAVTALEPVVEEVAETTIELQFIELQFQDQSVTVPATEFTAAELGVSLDTERTLAEADNPPPPVVRPAAWLFDLFASREVSPAVTTDLGTLADTVDPYTDPETPRIELVDGAFRPIDSTDVPIPDMELLARRLEEAVLNNVGGRVVVEVPIRGMEPADPIAVARASALADKANEITEAGVVLGLEGAVETFAIGELALRQFIVLEGSQHNTRLGLDPRIADTLASLFVGIGSAGLPAAFSLDEAGEVIIAAGEPGFTCCDASAVDALLAGMVDDQPVITLPAAPAPHPQGREWAESLGIVQVVGEFTTPFKPGQDRIINIARISELTRGVIIEPGGRFSVNDFVGQRTASKGFVPAGMILEGVFVDSVGGGISQYATTLFNAAFFAGLDFIEYQSHTIYLSRYPYGREATVSYPAPDLVIENNSPYGVMLWPTTGRDSITVKLYSTPWVLSEQTDQWTRTVGTTCTRVTTERTRTYLSDGRSETDTVWAQYRPEGLKCDGSPSVTTTTTTTIPPEEGELQSGEEAGWEQGETGADTGQPGTDVGETGTDSGDTGTDSGETGTDSGDTGADAGETGADSGPQSNGSDVETDAPQTSRSPAATTGGESA